MTNLLLFLGIILICCLLMQRLMERFAIPSLLVFLILGMAFGVDGIFRISFNDYKATEIICSVCLVFIMFYGGFGTSFKAARPVLKQSVLLATLGVVMTAVLTGCFVHFALKQTWLASLLMGSVIASTDAASVFSILRGRTLNLKNNTASILEVESGSNDPMSYMLVIIFCQLYNGKAVSIPAMIMQQLLFGALLGLIIGKISAYFLKCGKFESSEWKTIFVFAAMLLSYAVPVIVGGNGYLGAYLCGMMLGNSKIPGKRQLVHFYDTLTGISQIMIFFLLGLLVTPSELPAVFLPALFITVFMTAVSRPLSVAAVLSPFKAPKNQILLVSWSGLRGAASIVFAIMAVLSGVRLPYNLYNLVYCVVLLSVLFQGTLLPFMAKKLNMIDNSVDVYKTFNDYEEENEISFVKIFISQTHPWANRYMSSIALPKEFLVSMIVRDTGKIIPNGATKIKAGDLLVIAAPSFINQDNISMQEIVIDKGNPWNKKKVKDLSLGKGKLIILIQRDGETIIPCGDDLIKEGDKMVMVQG
ncbi:MAG: potassium/proton antiporter [Eubacteriales bacterium]|nr:potassium/proton antiporter [Eubacteriales bacterium]